MEFLIILTTISLQFELFFLNVTQDISILLSSKILRISEMMERKKRDDDKITDLWAFSAKSFAASHYATLRMTGMKPKNSTNTTEYI